MLRKGNLESDGPTKHKYHVVLYPPRQYRTFLVAKYLPENLPSFLSPIWYNPLGFDQTNQPLDLGEHILKCSHLNIQLVHQRRLGQRIATYLFPVMSHLLMMYDFWISIKIKNAVSFVVPNDTFPFHSHLLDKNVKIVTVSCCQFNYY